MRRWTRRILLLVLVTAILSVALLLGRSSLSTWNEQDRQRSQAEQVTRELEERVNVLEQELKWRTSDEAVRQAALCFGPYVEPGTEVYTVAGLRGCVAPRALP